MLQKEVMKDSRFKMSLEQSGVPKVIEPIRLVTNPEWDKATHELQNPDYTCVNVGPKPAPADNSPEKGES